MKPTRVPFIAAAAVLALAQCAMPAGGPAYTEARAVDCIDLSAVAGRAAEDERTIRFELIGGQVYRNRLSGRCPGLARSSRGFGALAFEPQGGRLCRGDTVRVTDPSTGGAARAGIPCPLGRFVPATPAQAPSGSRTPR